MKTKSYLSVFLLVNGVLAAENGLWVEGKDQPSRRVNKDATPAITKLYTNVAESMKNSVVNISSSKKPIKRDKREKAQDLEQFKQFFGDDFFEKFFGGQNGFPGEDRQAASLGSGFILSSDGYVVTNNHVVDKGDDITVIMSDETEYPAKVVGKDAKTDIALLKIEPKKKLDVVILGDSSQMKVGDLVVAIGNPFGLSQTTTHGIVSAKERSIGFGAYDDFIQTDASINPGNSGGPLLNISGEVIGINTAIVASANGIGFAIPINLAKDILFSLKTNGAVKRSWLGVMIQKVTEDLARSLKLPKKQGALVTDLVEDAPAKKAGIVSGDVITKFDGKVIDDYHQLPLLVAGTPIGKSVDVEVFRDGKIKTLKVIVEKLDEKNPEAVGEVENKKADTLSLVVSELTPELAKETGNKGVLVVDVDDDSPAKKYLRKGDILLEVNRKPIQTVSDYQKAISTLHRGDDVLLKVRRQKSTTFVVFSLAK